MGRTHKAAKCYFRAYYHNNERFLCGGHSVATVCHTQRHQEFLAFEEAYKGTSGISCHQYSANSLWNQSRQPRREISALPPPASQSERGSEGRHCQVLAASWLTTVLDASRSRQGQRLMRQGVEEGGRGQQGGGTGPALSGRCKVQSSVCSI